MQEKIPDFIPGKYDPSKKTDFGANFRIFVFDHLTKIYAAVKLNQITTAGSSNIK